MPRPAATSMIKSISAPTSTTDAVATPIAQHLKEAAARLCARVQIVVSKDAAEEAGIKLTDA